MSSRQSLSPQQLAAKPLAKPLQAVLYIRVSSVGQVEGTSLENQYAACRTKAASMGAQVVGVYQDVQSGADYASRKGLQQALAQLEAKEANALIIYDMSRYSRDSEHQQLIRKRVLAARAKLVFCTLEIGDLSSPEAALAFGVSGIFAEYERLKIRQRTHDGCLARARSGFQPSRSRRPLGYDLVTKNHVMLGHYPLSFLGTYVIKEEEAAYIRLMFEKFVEGESLRGITKMFAAMGFSTQFSSQGAKGWYAGTLRYMMQNPVYKGFATYGRYVCDNDETRLAAGFKTKSVRRKQDESEWILIPAPSIVSVETWEKAQQIMAENRSRISGNPGRRYMLSGILKCPVCGTVMRGNKTAHTKSWVYSCRLATSPHNYEERCRSSGYWVEQVDRLVIDQLISWANSPYLLEEELLRQQEQAKAKSPDADARKREINRKLRELEQRRDSLMEGQVRAISANLGDEVYRQYEEKLKEIGSQIEPLRHELNGLEASSRPVLKKSQLRSKSQEMAALLQMMRKVFESEHVPVGEKHKALSRLIEKIELDHIIYGGNHGGGKHVKSVKISFRDA